MGGKKQKYALRTGLKSLTSAGKIEITPPPLEKINPVQMGHESCKVTSFIFPSYSQSPLMDIIL